MHDVCTSYICNFDTIEGNINMNITFIKIEHRRNYYHEAEVEYGY